MTSENRATNNRAESDSSSDGLPNVIVIIADDLGYGDLGCHGNELIETPTIDDVYGESTRLTRFYGAPFCSPSRASLLTGRYHYRTGVIGVILGRALMYPDEVTIADVLSECGYRTGCFGKWHLGDNSPFRPIDRGFQRSLVHRGGGIGQRGDFPENSWGYDSVNGPASAYFDPVLRRDGEAEETKGYCTDVFFNEAIDFIQESSEKPFFTYLATNTPHTPLQIHDEYADPYREQGLGEPTARLYGMISNIDDNVSRLLETLESMGIADETLVIFTSDHGAQPIPPEHQREGELQRFNSGLRGHKGMVYDGGIRVPCFIRWPGKIDAGRDLDGVAHFIDLAPTIFDIVGHPNTTGDRIDGSSLLPALKEGREIDFDRRISVQAVFNEDQPQMFENACVISQRYKLVNGTELYDLEDDPGEQVDLAAREPDVVSRLREEYTAWYEEMKAAHEFEPPAIDIGTQAENPVLLTRHDWRGPERDWWSDEDVGYWLVAVQTADEYDVTVQVQTLESMGTVHLRFESVHRTKPIATGERELTFDAVPFASEEGMLEAWLEFDSNKYGARYVEIVR